MLLDVTTVISAEDYIRSQNQHRRPEDPFARQCFAELTQTLIFMDRAFVPHPVLPHPRPEDFGARPRLLKRLMEAGGIRPLRMDVEAWNKVEVLDAEVLRALRTNGVRTLIQFVDQAAICDRAPTKASLQQRILEWSTFQAREVRTHDGHSSRITTSDGVEDDDFGHWVRSATDAIDAMLEPMAPTPAEAVHLVATIARGLRYAVRGGVAGEPYQSHPMRRDFSLTFELSKQGLDSSLAMQVIEIVRGIHGSIGESVGATQLNRMRLMEMQLPLLGGRLWRSDEVGQRNDDDWIDLVVERIMQYRQESEPLRWAIRHCLTDEDATRLLVELEEAGIAVLERLGLRRVEVSSVERDLMDGAASVAQAVTGVPKMNGVLIGSHSVARKVVGRTQRTSYQQFLYREFTRAYRASA